MKDLNFIKVLEESIKENWELPALSNYQSNTKTYGGIGNAIIKIHNLYKECDIKHGDKISLIGKSSINWAITYLSTISYGATIVPILVDFHIDNITNIINHSDSKLLFVDDYIYEKLDMSKLPDLKAVIKLSDFTSLYEDDKQKCNITLSTTEEITKDVFSLPEISNENIGVISYTSGTTGFSKGVMLPLKSLMANVHFAWNNMPLHANDNLLSILPLAHAYGCAFEFLWPFSKGVHITFLGKILSPQLMIDAFQEIKPQLLLMVPLIVEKIYKRKLQGLLAKNSMKILLSIPFVNKLIYKKINIKLSQVFGNNFREVIIGGAALNKDVEIFLRKIGFNFSVGYGMTECGPLISYANWDKSKTGSCGRLVDSLNIKIDSDDPKNTPGEIMVKGTNVMTGYYKNPEETKKIIDDDGWLHTGDLGIIDNEGFIFIKGRIKCMILGPSGENIYPEEIESKLSNYPYIAEQLVISENNKLIALVYPDFDKITKKQIKDKELKTIMDNTKKLINKTLPKYSQIAEIRIQEKEFEKTPKQSIKRFMYEQKKD
jgi:long-chain acyl-CoA synthetase